MSQVVESVLALTQEQVKRLEAAILELPGKFGFPLIQLINGFTEENKPVPPSIIEAEEVKS